jgi:hypothetical protein
MPGPDAENRQRAHLYIQIRNGNNKSVSQGSTLYEKGKEQRAGARRIAAETWRVHA